MTARRRMILTYRSSAMRMCDSLRQGTVLWSFRILGFETVQFVLFINAEASALEHQFEHTSPVAPFWTVAIRSETSRQNRFFLVIGASQLPAAARGRRQAFAIQLVKSIAIFRGIAFSVTRRTFESRCPFVENSVKFGFLDNFGIR
jgi:hypothetical protein